MRRLGRWNWLGKGFFRCGFFFGRGQGGGVWGVRVHVRMGEGG